MNDQPLDGEVLDPPPAKDIVRRSKAGLPIIVPGRLTKAARTVVDDALTALERTVGGRKRLVDALSLGGSGKIPPARAQYILGLLADPKNDGYSLRRIANKAGVGLEDLLQLYRDSTVMRAHIQSVTTVAAGLPGVVADVMARSVPYEDTCGVCAGVGQVTPEPTKKQPNPSPQPCGACRGSGRLTYLPDLERQKLALSLGGLLKGGTGTTVNVLQQQAQAPAGTGPSTPLVAGDTLVQMQKLTEQALRGTGPGLRSSASPAPLAPPAPPEPED